MTTSWRLQTSYYHDDFMTTSDFLLSWWLHDDFRLPTIMMTSWRLQTSYYHDDFMTTSDFLLSWWLHDDFRLPPIMMTSWRLQTSYYHDDFMTTSDFLLSCHCRNHQKMVSIHIDSRMLNVDQVVVDLAIHDQIVIIKSVNLLIMIYSLKACVLHKYQTCKIMQGRPAKGFWKGYDILFIKSYYSNCVFSD